MSLAGGCHRQIDVQHMTDIISFFCGIDLPWPWCLKEEKLNCNHIIFIGIFALSI